MCICVNCRHVHSCLTYYLIQKQHKKQYSIKINNNFFIPQKTLININYCNLYMTFDWDLIECLSFIETPGNWINY
uniref:Ycf34 n=1 Tax=Hydropuntia rangiferina TaxID=338881 RepID=A0A345U8A6_9FLOR|nr:hypothetical protein [Hydropuntia rangiferina]AXI96692.1 hypothetical protein [Hydropuntia rangiferina]UAD87375.1 hypothetical protein [Hydropuntia rangiferina]